MAEFINLNYFFRADTADYQLVLDRGFFDNHKTNGEYGKGIYLVDDKRINLNDKNVVLNVDLSDIINILFVESYELLIEHYIAPNYPKILGEVDRMGKTSAVGNKYIKRFAKDVGLNGIKIKDENTLVLYKTTNIRFIRLFDEDLKTLRNYTPMANPSYALLWGPKLPLDPSLVVGTPEYLEAHNKTGENIVDENGNIIVWGIF